ncbi:MAG TPA: FHA domain-containing protein [Verrucomicrobiota bacterium]|nr:FHA domain-containing protein [Verrucomicrobiota bacterium]HOK79048.1 FHA domain-containing protein [Verrucomicrobiota bacterium]
MVLLEVLSGPTTEKAFAARKFPFLIGRSPKSDLRLELGGVWPEHARIEFDRSEGFKVAAAPDALLIVNGTQVQRARLRKGDVLEIGAVKLRFEFSPVRQRGLRLRELSCWLLIAVLFVVQASVMYWLAR